MASGTGIPATVSVVGRAVQTIAHENPVHPVRDYLNALTWDARRGLITGLADISAWTTALMLEQSLPAFLPPLSPVYSDRDVKWTMSSFWKDRRER